MEKELSEICASILQLLDEHLIPTASTGESKVFYLKMKGDYHRYLAEFKTGADRKEAAEHTLLAYKAAQVSNLQSAGSSCPAMLAAAASCDRARAFRPDFLQYACIIPIAAVMAGPAQHACATGFQSACFCISRRPPSQGLLYHSTHMCPAYTAFSIVVLPQDTHGCHGSALATHRQQHPATPHS